MLINTILIHSSGYYKDALIFWGQIKIFFAKELDRLGMATEEQKQLVIKAWKFEWSVDRYFTEYAVPLTGQTASKEEEENLKGAVMSLDNSPTQFEGILNGEKRRLLMKLRIYARHVKSSNCN